MHGMLFKIYLMCNFSKICAWNRIKAPFAIFKFAWAWPLMGGFKSDMLTGTCALMMLFSVNCSFILIHQGWLPQTSVTWNSHKKWSLIWLHFCFNLDCTSFLHVSFAFPSCLLFKCPMRFWSFSPFSFFILSSFSLWIVSTFNSLSNF